MSSIAHGLSVGGESADPIEGDLATTEDFMASLAQDLGEEPKPIDVSDEPVAPEAVPAEAGVADPDETDNSTADTGDEGLTPEQIELRELRALYGRQSNELGELRKLVQTPTVEEPEPQYAPPPPITSEVVGQIEEALESGQSGEQLATWALIEAPHLYETILDTWADQGGSAARRAAQFDMRYQQALQENEAQEQAQAAQEFQSGLAASLDTQVAALAPEYGIEVGTAATDELLAETIGKVPVSIQKLVVSKDASEREDGLRVVLALASASKVTTASDEAATGKAIQEALAAGKGAAAVGGGALRAAPPAAEGSVPKPDLITALEESLVATPTTSISEGLTFGKRT